MVLLTASGRVNNIAAKYFPWQITPHGEELLISEEIKILIFVIWGTTTTTKNQKSVGSRFTFIVETLQ